MDRAKARRLFANLERDNPHPTTELRYRNNFQLLVAVILSAQCTDTAVNRATPALFAAAPNPRAMLALGATAIKTYIRSIGLYNNKAENIIKTCRLLLERHGGRIPATREALEALPGVGRKTANVILNTAFAQPEIAVDTHIYRVANRTGLAPGRNVREVEDGLLAIVPKRYLSGAHHWLILHGRYVCKARKPDCERCVIRRLCEWPGKALSRNNRMGARSGAGAQ